MSEDSDRRSYIRLNGMSGPLALAVPVVLAIAAAAAAIHGSVTANSVKIDGLSHRIGQLERTVEKIHRQ